MTRMLLSVYYIMMIQINVYTLWIMDVEMNKEVILKNWMTIGNSSKKKNYVSNKGRIQTGAKGIVDLHWIDQLMYVLC